MTQRKEPQIDDSIDEFELAQMLVAAMTHVMGESTVLDEYEKHLGKRFPDLEGLGIDGARYPQLEALADHLGGPPKGYVVLEGREDEIPKSDNYAEAALREVLSVYRRARTSVLRANLFMAGSDVLRTNPEFVDRRTEKKSAALHLVLGEQAFWEHAETAYIRLASYWDRVGQVLEFAFFNVRKFEHSTFSSVMHKISGNVIAMRKDKKGDPVWHRLWTFHNSEAEDGYMWLSKRRNMMVHNLHLHPLRKNHDAVYKAHYNHLQDRQAKTMKPGNPADEARLLLQQLVQATTIFDDFIALALQSPSRKVSPFLHH